MLDLGYVRDHLDVIDSVAVNRGIALDLNPFRAIDAERRQLITQTERLKAERNNASDEIVRLKKLFPYQDFVIMGKVGRVTRNEHVTVRIDAPDLSEAPAKKRRARKAPETRDIPPTMASRPILEYW